MHALGEDRDDVIDSSDFPGDHDNEGSLAGAYRRVVWYANPCTKYRSTTTEPSHHGRTQLCSYFLVWRCRWDRCGEHGEEDVACNGGDIAPVGSCCITFCGKTRPPRRFACFSSGLQMTLRPTTEVLKNDCNRNRAFVDDGSG